jgi:hypothetical protein
MKLFYSLPEELQHEALHYCSDLVLNDIITDGVKLDPITPEEHELKAKLEEAVAHINTLQTKEEKVNYLLGNETISKAIYDIALEMAKGSFYVENNEMIVWIDELVDDEEEENNTEDTTPALPPKKDHTLN